MSCLTPQLQGTEWLVSRQRRGLDIALASASMPIAIPLGALGMAAFSFETHLNPLFIQERVGRHIGPSFRPFNIIKLRTMPSSVDFADSSNGHDDPRASRVGRVLRKYTIDETPQFLQVLAGDMSIVGPRPIVKSEFDATMDLLSCAEQKKWVNYRKVARPGLLSEFGNATRSTSHRGDDGLYARAYMDIEYAQTASFEEDRRIVSESLSIGGGLLALLTKRMHGDKRD